MKLADITAAAISKNPNLEVEVEQEGKDDVTVVFRNPMLMPEKERQAAQGIFETADEIMKADNQDSMIRREAEVLKSALSKVVADKKHITLLERIFSANQDTRDAAWIALYGEYQDKVQPGEASPSQKH